MLRSNMISTDTSENGTMIIALETRLDMVDFPAAESAENLYMSCSTLMTEAVAHKESFESDLQKTAVEFNATALIGVEVMEVAIGEVSIEDAPTFTPTLYPTGQDRGGPRVGGLATEWVILIALGAAVVLLAIVFNVWWFCGRKGYTVRPIQGPEVSSTSHRDVNVKI